MQRIAFYDAQCPLCYHLKNILSALDWKKRIQWSAVQTIEETPYAFLRDRPLMKRIHMISADGSVISGAAAIREMLISLPLAKPAGLFMKLPGITPAADIVYSYVSESRIKWFGRYSTPRFD
ncbi:thiol-disulfide oxidoreductase DCC family protein [Metabacillus mangrovi]|uniref:thiol-disulfide oxidoreductase DCC family protein n=1 Tax=Metabacillus mangrovi TaxID=1491830 RepID=UPI0013910A0F|nr:DUF393 domain-containing protein [Metabacillus mangrovi]